MTNIISKTHTGKANSVGEFQIPAARDAERMPQPTAELPSTYSRESFLGPQDPVDEAYQHARYLDTVAAMPGTPQVAETTEARAAVDDAFATISENPEHKPTAQMNREATNEIKPEAYAGAARHITRATITLRDLALNSRADYDLAS